MARGFASLGDLTEPVMTIMRFVTAHAALLVCLLLGACSWRLPGLGAPAAPDGDINAWFETQFERQLARSPMWQTYLGRKTNYDQWDDVSPAFQAETHALGQAALAEMRERFDFVTLSESEQLSYRLFEYEREQEQRNWPFRDHWYEFSQFRGPHSGLPAFLINQHRIDSVEDARAYIARLQGMDEALGQHQANAQRQFEKGIHPPRWAYPQMIETTRNLIAGQPFEPDAEPSALLADFRKKIGALELNDAVRDELEAEARQALIEDVQPAYRALIAMFERHGAQASAADGAWKLPAGQAYYASQLRKMTTTDMTADEIHDLGLAEVARIHDEMRDIKQAVGFDGSLQDFFIWLREDPEGRFSYPNTDAGRAAYLAEAKAIIDRMRERLDELFGTRPEAELIVKRVEPFREQAAGKAFYQRPAADGSRPGIYYANLFDMDAMPTYQMEALAYHEGIPGHHMQLAIAQELEGVPSFRRFGGYTAYIEGWGLYSEYVPKEMGFYQDPYSDFGRLAMELWRAARLVVDTGLHARQWTREQAIAYLETNTPNPASDCRRAIERYIVMPGQATAYKIGMLKILALREAAEKRLGERFDLRGFHDAILRSGALPLTMLEENIRAWEASVAG